MIEIFFVHDPLLHRRPPGTREGSRLVGRGSLHGLDAALDLFLRAVEAVVVGGQLVVAELVEGVVVDEELVGVADAEADDAFDELGVVDGVSVGWVWM